MCCYAPFGSKEMWNWHTTVTIKKQSGINCRIAFLFKFFIVEYEKCKKY